MDMKTIPLPEKLNGLRINGDRLWASLMELAQIGATAKGGVCRLTLTDLDKQGRDLVSRWASSPDWQSIAWIIPLPRTFNGRSDSSSAICDRRARRWRPLRWLWAANRPSCQYCSSAAAPATKAKLFPRKVPLCSPGCH